MKRPKYSQYITKSSYALKAMSYAPFEYLKFLSKSTNQHGVHSPFVYDLVTKCFYDKKKYPEYNSINNFISKKQISNKQAHLLFRLGRYFNFKNVLLVQDRYFDVSQTLAIANPEFTNVDISGYDRIKEKLDLVYLETKDLSYFKKEIEKLLLHTHNNSLLLISDIHKSKNAQHYWNSLKNHSKVTVTIDTFTYGFVFLRKEQAKEHFVIRL